MHNDDGAPGGPTGVTGDAEHRARRRRHPARECRPEPSRHPRRRPPRLRAVRESPGAGDARPPLSRICWPASTKPSRRRWSCGRSAPSTRPSARPFRTVAGVPRHGGRPTGPEAPLPARHPLERAPRGHCRLEPQARRRVRRRLHRGGHRLLQALPTPTSNTCSPTSNRTWGWQRSDVLHTAQSLHHDHVPAKRFGLANAWIDRQRLSAGGSWGATARVDPMPSTDFVFFSMGEMAEDGVGPWRDAGGNRRKSVLPCHPRSQPGPPPRPAAGSASRATWGSARNSCPPSCRRLRDALPPPRERRTPATAPHPPTAGRPASRCRSWSAATFAQA